MFGSAVTSSTYRPCRRSCRASATRRGRSASVNPSSRARACPYAMRRRQRRSLRYRSTTSRTISAGARRSTSAAAFTSATRAHGRVRVSVSGRALTRNSWKTGAASCHDRNPCVRAIFFPSLARFYMTDRLPTRCNGLEALVFPQHRDWFALRVSIDGGGAHQGRLPNRGGGWIIRRMGASYAKERLRMTTRSAAR
jgi:hypothetical protein